MKHQSREDIARVARLHSGIPRTKPMSQHERLQRWAELLEQQPRRTLATLRETEYQPPRMRDAMRCDNTAITIAFADPVLREEGLAGDSYGDAKRFFGLSDNQLHWVVCYCHGGATMMASAAARRLQTFVRKTRPGLFRRLLRFARA